MPKLEAVTAKKEEMLKELKAFRENDPEVLEKIKKDSQVAHDAANRWTGETFSHDFIVVIRLSDSTKPSFAILILRLYHIVIFLLE